MVRLDDASVSVRGTPSGAAAVARQPSLRARLACWRYPDGDASRDLRIDLLRGLVMCVMVVVHIEIFSMLDLLVWERMGLVSGAEGFVILSGVVLGMVHRKTIARGGLPDSASKLWARAWQLYCVNVCLAGSILLLSYVPFIDVAPVTTFHDIGANVVPAYGSGNPWLNTLVHVAALLVLWTMVRTRFLFRWIPR